MVLSTALFDRPPFLNCICHGVILDSTGQKLSKRLNNYADPLELFDKYGSDALRVTMLSSNVVKGQELLIDKDGKMVFDQLRLFMKPIWNSYHFFCLYANIDNVKAEINYNSDNIIDQYIISKLVISIKEIESSMDKFDIQESYNVISDFFEILNNWYIRRSRNRFWKAEHDADKRSAYSCLYGCLEAMMRAASPLIPMLSEHIYQGLGHSDSVHLTDYPKLDNMKINHELVSVMDQVRDICSTALFIRSSENIRVRQPLQNLKIITNNSEPYKQFEDLIKDEINVKEVIYNDNLSDSADLKLSLNFKVLGKRLPKKMKNFIKLSKSNEWSYENNILKISDEELLPEEYSLILEPRSIAGAKSLSNNQGLIALDLKITQELESEGYARDLVRIIQQARRDAEFNVSDRIILNIESNGKLVDVINSHSNYICQQTLSELKTDSLQKDSFKAEFTTKSELLEKEVVIEICRI
jgi:isoleucyl-tRNA synthetase